MLSKVFLQMLSSNAARTVSKPYYSLAANFLSSVSANHIRKSFFVKNSFARGDFFPFNSDIDSLTVLLNTAAGERAAFTNQFAQRYALSKVLFPLLGEAFVFEERDLSLESFSRMLGFGSERDFKCIAGEKQIFINHPSCNPPLPSAFECFYSKLFKLLFSHQANEFARIEIKTFEKLLQVASHYRVKHSLQILGTDFSKNLFPENPSEFRTVLCFEALNLFDSFSTHLFKRFGKGKTIKINSKKIPKNFQSIKNPAAFQSSNAKIVFVPVYFDVPERAFIIVDGDISLQDFSETVSAVMRSGLRPETTVIVSENSFQALFRFAGFENGVLLHEMHESFRAFSESEEAVAIAFPKKEWVDAKVFEETAMTIAHVLNLSLLKKVLGREQENIFRAERLSRYCDYLNVPASSGNSIKSSVKMCRAILEKEKPLN